MRSVASLLPPKRGDSAVLLFAAAMAPKLFAGMQTVTGQVLTDYKTNIQNHLQVQTALQSNHCIACTKSEGAACYYSPAGRTEYERTGVCERCWDCIVNPGSGIQEKLQQCNKLNARGVEQANHWIMVAKARSSLTVSQQDYVWITDVNANRRRFGNPFVW